MLKNLKYEKSKVCYSRIRRYSKGHTKSHPRNLYIPGINNFFFSKSDMSIKIILSVCMYEITWKSIKRLQLKFYIRGKGAVVLILIRKLSRPFYIKTYMRLSEHIEWNSQSLSVKETSRTRVVEVKKHAFHTQQVHFYILSCLRDHHKRNWRYVYMSELAYCTAVKGLLDIKITGASHSS